jgi:hypothetical protein
MLIGGTIRRIFVAHRPCILCHLLFSNPSFGKHPGNVIQKGLYAFSIALRGRLIRLLCHKFFSVFESAD